MEKILLVTDKVFGNRNFIEELEDKYEVNVTGFINTALYWLRKPDEYILAIVEIGMPPYDFFSLKESSDGKKTGLVFYENVIKELGIPTILWSWDDEFEGEVISKFDRQLIFVQKKLEEDDQLLNAVENFLDLYYKDPAN